MKDLKQLYKTACSIPPGVALAAARLSENDEERNFIVYIADMNLQRAQWDYIESSQNK